MSLTLGKVLANPQATLSGLTPDAPLVIRRPPGQQDGAALDTIGDGRRLAETGARDDVFRPTNPNVRPTPHELSEAEKKLVTELRDRDGEVRAHEQKHLSAAGDLARGGAHYEYVIGPDGKPYAVAGAVHVDTSPVNHDPAATAEKARRLQRAALSPGDPSSADHSVATAAATLEGQARSQSRHDSTASERQPAGAGEYTRARQNLAPLYELALWA